MDRMWVCGTYDPGPIPGESTHTNTSILLDAVFVCALTETVPAHSFVRNRRSERCGFATRETGT
jgi:hypothetical protein